MSLWRRKSLLVNPYYRTAFRVMRVPREVTRRRTLVQLIGQTRRIAAADPQAHTICGEPVTETEINGAEKILLDASQRVLEELIHHASEPLPVAPILALAGEAAALMADEEGPLTPTELTPFEPWLHQVVTEWLASHPGADPSFGALELELTPPFGRVESE